VGAEIELTSGKGDRSVESVRSRDHHKLFLKILCYQYFFALFYHRMGPVMASIADATGTSPRSVESVLSRDHDKSFLKIFMLSITPHSPLWTSSGPS
jgi:hypothetical protein